jgi:hypothetical protein
LNKLDVLISDLNDDLNDLGLDCDDLGKNMKKFLEGSKNRHLTEAERLL